MLLITEKTDACYRTIPHGTDVFKKALRFVAKGEYRFHVTDGAELGYDLRYIENNTIYADKLKLDGVRRQATVQEMIPIIDRWTEEGGYERVFLATEDADILEEMHRVPGLRTVQRLGRR